MKTGSLRVLGDLNANVWQRIHRTYLQPADSYTKLLLHGEGTNLSTTIKDASGNNKIVSVVAGAAIKTDSYKFGTSSLWFDGEADCLSVPDSTDWNLGSVYTIDFWVYPTASPFYVCGQRQDANNRWYVSYNGTNWDLAYVKGGSINHKCRADDEVSLNTWTHVAFVRFDSITHIFINGTELSRQVGSDGGDLTDDLSSVFYVGSDGNGNYHTGYLDEFRVSKGIARWTSDFTPPVIPYVGDDPISSLTISDLSSDTDEMYLLRCKFVSGINNFTGILRLNNDTNNNYGYHFLAGSDSSVSSTRAGNTNHIQLIASVNAGELGHTDALIYSKSGFIRTVLLNMDKQLVGTTIGGIQEMPQIWNNTVDEIYSLTVASQTGSGIGTNSLVELYRRIGPV